ncbi:MAG: class I SAM-dependent rRNA methyltransferase [Kiritimatiellae bacterium]|nr:class I SAM-dependent rRNA methyltransferase [Kiritimatiellia bacterium]
MERVVLRKGRERSVLKGHPWVFSGAVEGGEAAAGELVEVCDSKGGKIALGWYSPASQIRVRIVPDAPVADLVAAAVGRRADFFANAYTNAVRLVNAESDGLPGVVADYYAGHVVCQFTSAGADARKAEIADALMKFAPFCLGVSERLDADSRAREGLATDASCPLLSGAEPPELIEVVEGPVKFLVDVRRGHTTGFYLDQRDARAAVGALANGADVLNCFCYTGGFGLFARACGAAKVTQVDVSADALALAKRNESLAHLCGTEMEYVEADVFQFLRKCRDEGRRFDMVVLDPPKFAATKGQLMRAARGYKDINLLAMKLLKPNGYLATFSCSGAMTPEFFDTILAEAAEDAKKGFQVVARTRAGMDHPVALSFPEGAYLKGVVLRSLS